MARPPQTLAETIVAHCRPQPAIPSLLVLLLTLFYAATLAGKADVAWWSIMLVVAGVVASCGLAIAAGFCSLFPPVAWIVLASLAFGILSRMPGSSLSRATVVAGMVAAAAMVVAQLWRVRTGRFSPTITDEPAGD